MNKNNNEKKVKTLIWIVSVLIIGLIAFSTYFMINKDNSNNTKDNESSKVVTKKEDSSKDNNKNESKENEQSNSTQNTNSNNELNEITIQDYKANVVECNVHHANNGTNHDSCDKSIELRKKHPKLIDYKQEAINEANKILEKNTNDIKDDVSKVKAEFLKSRIHNNNEEFSEKELVLFDAIEDNMLKFGNNYLACKYSKNAESYCTKINELKKENVAKYVNYESIQNLLIARYQVTQIYEGKSQKFTELKDLCPTDPSKCNIPYLPPYEIFKAGTEK